MNVAKWLLLALLALPLMELAAFIAVGAAIGFGWAFLLVLGTTISPASWCCAMPAATTSPGSASP